MILDFGGTAPSLALPQGHRLTQIVDGDTFPTVEFGDGAGDTTQLVGTTGRDTAVVQRRGDGAGDVTRLGKVIELPAGEDPVVLGAVRHLASGHDPLPHHETRLARCAHEPPRLHTRNPYDDVDAVEQWSGENPAVAGDGIRSTSTRLLVIPLPATWTRVRRRDQLDITGEADGGRGAGDGHRPVLEGLTKAFETSTWELGYLIEKEHSPMGQGDLTGAGASLSPTDEGRHADVVMGRPVWRCRFESAPQPGGGPDACHLNHAFGVEGREDPG